MNTVDRLRERVLDDRPELRARFVVEADADAAFDFIKDFVPLTPSYEQKGFVLREDGEVIAALLYVEFNGTNLFAHLAGRPGRRWLNRDFLFWGLHYPFVQLGCSRVTGWVEADNADSLRFLEHLGFVREATLTGAGTHGQDVILVRLFREEWLMGRRQRRQDSIRSADQRGDREDGGHLRAGAAIL
jgi:RimJ/RimL family protein N-acetyltransferase